jgi:N-acyl-D-aspartate/D-glutamate deacylase
MFETIIRGGKVFDGAGNPWFRADVGVKDGKIECIGDLSTAKAQRIIDAKKPGLAADPRNAYTHLAVAPGFIDCHNHGDFTLLAGKMADSMIRQGVVTQITGHCGFSPAPANDKNRKAAENLIGRVPAPNNLVTWSSFDDYLTTLDSKGLVTNIFHFVGHTAIRQAVIGPDERPATEEEIELMKDLLVEAMEAGAAGLSAGLEFFPARRTESEEIN